MEFLSFSLQQFYYLITRKQWAGGHNGGSYNVTGSAHPTMDLPCCARYLPALTRHLIHSALDWDV